MPPSASYYPSQISASVNYSIGMKAAYRLTGYWLIGGFFDFNNALNYTPATLAFTSAINSIPPPQTLSLANSPAGTNSAPCSCP
jgi:hypothetical protein